MTILDEAPVGARIAGWRKARRLSQLGLALEAGISARHLSFLETGRSRPSREMVLTLAAALRLPLRERNALLLAAGFAPAFRETPLGHPRMAEVMGALRLLLSRHEPFGAVVFDRNWDLVMANAGYLGLLAEAVPAAVEGLMPYELVAEPRPNLLRLVFGAAGFRRLLANWPEVAGMLLHRVRQEIARDPDPQRSRLLADIEGWAREALPEAVREGAPDLIVPVEVRRSGRAVRLYSTLATLGTAQDITLQELRIETFHPADDRVEGWLRG